MAATKRSYGTGSLYTRTSSTGAETWYGRWRAGGQQHGSRIGPKRVPATREGMTRAQAEKELRRLMKAAEDAPRRAPAGERLSIEELGERYLADMERLGRKRSSIRGVSSALRVRIVPHFGEKALDSYRPADVQAFIAWLEAEELSPKTIRGTAGLVSTLFRYARKKRLASATPCDDMELPGLVDDGDIHYLEPNEVEALVNAAVAGPYQAVDRGLYLTAAMTGLRQGELLALRWRDVDWRARRIRVRQNYVLGEFGTPKSKRSTRSVPMADAVGGEMDRLHKACGEPAEDALVFPDPLTGEPLKRSMLLVRYRKALKAAKLDEALRFHDLRHTFGTRMAAAGVSMRMLQEWLGHRDIQTTQIYADYAPSENEVAQVNAAFAVVDPGPLEDCAHDLHTQTSENRESPANPHY
jgi:integrase